MTRVPGLFQSLDEATAVMNVLRPAVDKEAHRAGFFLPAVISLGSDVMFTRRPVHDDAAHAFDEARIDGFIAVPSAALVYPAYAPLLPEDQSAIRSPIAETRARLIEVTRRTDEALRGGASAKRVVVRVPVGAQLRSDFIRATHKAAHAAVAPRAASPELLDQTEAILRELRARKPK